jgi:arsenate reductase-like glutaredoxin family protein
MKTMPHCTFVVLLVVALVVPALAGEAQVAAPPAPAKAEAAADNALDAEVKAVVEALKALAKDVEDLSKSTPTIAGIQTEAEGLGKALTATLGHIDKLLARKEGIQDAINSALSETAAAQGEFLKEVKAIDEEIAHIRKLPGAPEAIQRAAKQLEAVKDAADKGARCVEPLRGELLKVKVESEVILQELALHPLILRRAIQVCGLYRKIGSAANVTQLVVLLTQARDSLQGIYSGIKRLATNTEQALQKLDEARKGAGDSAPSGLVPSVKRVRP